MVWWIWSLIRLLMETELLPAASKVLKLIGSLVLATVFVGHRKLLATSPYFLHLLTI
jgi:hypothetical protein